MSQNSTNISFLNISASFALIGLYLCAALFPSFHKLTQHSHVDTPFCSEEAEEQNPCHQTVYHHNIKNGCKHNTHLHVPKHNCQLCDVLLTEKHSFDYISFFTARQNIASTCQAFYTQIILNFSHPSISLRGPPSIS